MALTQAKELKTIRPLVVQVYFAGGDRKLMQNWLGSEFIPKDSIGRIFWR